MRAMILAAGRGERLRPLTDNTPKPLLQVGGKPLVEYHIENLVNAGIKEIIINLSYMGDKIRKALGDGNRFGAQIVYSEEGETALETGGGILRALSFLGERPGDNPFIVVNSDIWTDFPFSQLPETQLPEELEGLAHLVLIDNPSHHPQGDFVLENGKVISEGYGNTLTFSGIGVYSPELFSECTEEHFPLAPLLRKAMKLGQVTGQYYDGAWMDAGTRQRLDELDEKLSRRS